MYPSHFSSLVKRAFHILCHFLKSFILPVLVFLLVILTPANSFAQDKYTKICLQAAELEKAGRFDDAIGKYTEAVNLSPEKWEAYNYRAKLNYYRGRYTEAVNDASKAITLSPGILPLYSLRAFSLFALEKYPEAISDFNTSLVNGGFNDPESYLSYFKRGCARFYTGQYQDAIRDFNLAAGLAENFKKEAPEIYLFRGRTNSELGNYPEAIKDFDSYLAVRPVDMSAVFFQGQTFLKAGETEKARSNAVEILDSDPAKKANIAGGNVLDVYNTKWDEKRPIEVLPATTTESETVNEIILKPVAVRPFKFSGSEGGSFGIQLAKNPSLSEYWTESNPGLDYSYGEKPYILYSGEMEITIRPWTRTGFGLFGSVFGGIGDRTTVDGTKHLLNMGCLQYGGFLRRYLLVGSKGKPDFFLQYGLGKSELIGLNGIATMSGAIFNYSYQKELKASSWQNAIGAGLDWKLGKSGVFTLNLNYINQNIKEINYRIKMNLANTAEVGQSGILKNSVTGENVTALYSGLVLKVLIGFCF